MDLDENRVVLGESTEVLGTVVALEAVVSGLVEPKPYVARGSVVLVVSDVVFSGESGRPIPLVVAPVDAAESKPVEYLVAVHVEGANVGGSPDKVNLDLAGLPVSRMESFEAVEAVGLLPVHAVDAYQAEVAGLEQSVEVDPAQRPIVRVTDEARQVGSCFEVSVHHQVPSVRPPGTTGSTAKMT